MSTREIKARVADLRLKRELEAGRVRVGQNFSRGPRSRLWAPRVLLIGNSVRVGSDVRVEADGAVGDHVLLANSSAIVGPSDHDAQQVGRSIVEADWVARHPERLSRPFILGSDVWVGYGAVLMSGIKVGSSSIVAAGSVVVKDVEPNTIVGGNPARFLRARFDPQDLRMHWDLLEKRGLRLNLDDVATGLEDELARR